MKKHFASHSIQSTKRKFNPQNHTSAFLNQFYQAIGESLGMFVVIVRLHRLVIHAYSKICEIFRFSMEIYQSIQFKIKVEFLFVIILKKLSLQQKNLRDVNIQRSL